MRCKNNLFHVENSPQFEFFLHVQDKENILKKGLIYIEKTNVEDFIVFAPSLTVVLTMSVIGQIMYLVQC